MNRFSGGMIAVAGFGLTLAIGVIVAIIATAGIAALALGMGAAVGVAVYYGLGVAESAIEAMTSLPAEHPQLADANDGDLFLPVISAEYEVIS